MAILEDGQSVVLEDGEEALFEDAQIVRVPPAYLGGETRYEDYVYLGNAGARVETPDANPKGTDDVRRTGTCWRRHRTDFLDLL